MDARTMIEQFQPINAQEESDQQLILRYMNTFHDVYERHNLFGHMTSSPWILNQDATKVLMVYHTIYDSWGWCGGHCDGNQDIQYVSFKEGLEETGLQHLQLLSKDILSLEVLPVPPHQKNSVFVSSHVHLNVTFLYIANDQEILTMKPDENRGVKWIAIEDMDMYVKEEIMKPIYHKLMKKSKQYLNTISKKGIL